MRTLSHILSVACAVNEERCALASLEAGQECLTYGELAVNLARVAGLLSDEQVPRGRAVGLVSDNSIDMASALLGIPAAARVAMPLNPALSPAEMTSLLLHSGCRLVLSDRPLSLPGVRVLPLSSVRSCKPLSLNPAAVSEQDGALLIYTSGTTGLPKGVLLSHRNIVHNAGMAAERLRLGPGHVKLCLLPLFHTFGFISDLCTALFTGNKAVIMPVFQPALAGLVEEAVHHHRVHSFSAVPIMFDLMTRLGCGLSGGSLQFCVSGAAPLGQALAQRFLDRHGVRILPAYGLTEATCFCTLTPPDDKSDFTSIGTAAGTGIKVVSEKEEELGAGAVGELLVHGDGVFEGGYYKGSQECYSTRFPGWFKTGDLGCFDASGHFFIRGRSKNMVIRGGEKVYLEDLDRCLTGLEGLSDCATVRVDAEPMEKIVTFIVKQPGSSLDGTAVLAFLRSRISAAKLPDRVLFRDSIPRTATQKVRLAQLHAEAAACF